MSALELKLMSTTDDDYRTFLQTKHHDLKMELDMITRPASVPIPSIAYDMWSFGVSLYQLCSCGGATLWKIDSQDNADPVEFECLAYRWSQSEEFRESKLRLVSPPIVAH